MPVITYSNGNFCSIFGSVGMLGEASSLDVLARLLLIVRLLDWGLGGFGLGSGGGAGTGSELVDVRKVPSMVVFEMIWVGCRRW